MTRREQNGVGEDTVKPTVNIESGTEPGDIKREGESIVITFNNLSLDVENQNSPEVTVDVEKHPLTIEEGKSYCLPQVSLEQENDIMRELAQQAEKLKTLPELERLHRLLKLLKTRLNFAHLATIEKLALTKPNEAEWIKKHTGPGSSGMVELAEVLEHGYGVCRHLATAYLWFAQRAGMEGTFLQCDGDTITNIIRTDNDEALFKSTGSDKKLAEGHVWVEIKTTDGRWIPVCPSTGLIGDTEEGLAMFKNANFIGLGNFSLTAEAQPEQLQTQSNELKFLPGETHAKITFSLKLKSTKATVKLGKENGRFVISEIPPSNKPYVGQGILKITPNHKVGLMNLEIKDINIGAIHP